MSQQTQIKSTTIKRLGLALAAVGLMGAGGAIAVYQTNASAAAAAAVPQMGAASTVSAVSQPGAPAPVAAPLMTLPDFSVIAARNGPAVVNVSVTGSTKTGLDIAGAPQARGRGGDQFGDDPFFEFFRRFQGQGPQRQQRDVPTHGIGSGFIISP